MRALFLTILALCGLYVVAPATVQAQMPLECLPDSVWCDSMLNSIDRGKIPYPHPRTCFYEEQVVPEEDEDGKQAVPIFVYDGEGNLLNFDPKNPELVRPDHRKDKFESDSYCIGSHFVADALATGGWVFLCNNDWASKPIEGDELRGYYEAGSAPQTLRTTVCLMDPAECDERLAAKGVPE